MSFFTTRDDSGNLVDFYSIEIPCPKSTGGVMYLSSNMAGVATGFAFVGNPYYDCPGNEHWRRKDGDTCIECDASHPRAMPVADAYAALYAEWARERAEWAEIMRQDELNHLDAIAADCESEEDYLYRIQDGLMGVRITRRKTRRRINIFGTW